MQDSIYPIYCLVPEPFFCDDFKGANNLLILRLLIFLIACIPWVIVLEVFLLNIRQSQSQLEIIGLVQVLICAWTFWEFQFSLYGCMSVWRLTQWSCLHTTQTHFSELNNEFFSLCHFNSVCHKGVSYISEYLSNHPFVLFVSAWHQQKIGVWHSLTIWVMEL